MSCPSWHAPAVDRDSRFAVEGIYRERALRGEDLSLDRRADIGCERGSPEPEDSSEGDDESDRKPVGGRG